MKDFEKLEHAAFNAWPATEQVETQDLVLRFANGYTKRANSANILKQQNGDFDSLKQQVESFFKERHSPSIFRIPSFTQNEALDRFLADQSYQKRSLSLVLHRPLSEQQSQPSLLDPASNVEVIGKSAKQWLEYYCQLSEQVLDDQTAHLAILEKIQSATHFALLKVDDQVVACALGVLEGDTLGIFDVLTRLQDRGKGYANYLLNDLFSWALSKGANCSYLQVEAENHPAIKLYQKLAYRQCYQYWYRIKDCR